MPANLTEQFEKDVHDMTSSTGFWYRLLFKVKIYEASGDGFQKLVSQIYEWSDPGFESITPWGSWGDGGNDGWIPSSGHYFQIYGPKPTTHWHPTTAINKARDDFAKLYKKWPNIKKYSFVLNDRYCGIPAPIASSLQQLKSNFSLQDAQAIGTSKLENLFMQLEEDQRQIIVGGVPTGSPEFIDSRAVGDLLTYLANKPSLPSGFLNESPPDFDIKIMFNKLTGQIPHLLRAHSYQTATVQEFLDQRDSGLQQAISEEIRYLYNESKTIIPDTDLDAPNVRYVWLVEQLIPDTMRNHHIHTMKAYRDAAQIILAKYFESCDAFDHPSRDDVIDEHKLMPGDKLLPRS